LPLAQKISDSIVSDEEIRPSVVINIASNRAPCFPRMRGNSTAFRDIRERAVAVVMKQPAGHGLINFRYAVMPLAIVMDSARLVLLFAKVHELANKQIQQAVVVVIEPNSA